MAVGFSHWSPPGQPLDFPISPYETISEHAPAAERGQRSGVKLREGPVLRVSRFWNL